MIQAWQGGTERRPTANEHRLISRLIAGLFRTGERPEIWTGTGPTSVRLAFFQVLYEALSPRHDVILTDYSWAVDPRNERYQMIQACVRVPYGSSQPDGFRYLEPPIAGKTPARTIHLLAESLWQVSLRPARFVQLREIDWKPGALQIRLLAIARTIDDSRPQPAALIRWGNTGRYRMAIINLYDDNTREDLSKQWEAVQLLSNGNSPLGRARGSGMLSNLSLETMREIKAELQEQRKAAGRRPPTKREVCEAIARHVGVPFVSDSTLDYRLKEETINYRQL